MKKKIKNKAEEGRIKRHYRIRKAIFGTKVRPRVSVHRSHKNLYVQFIDDENDRTLLYCSTSDKGFKQNCPKGGNVESAKKFGNFVAQEANKKGIKEVVFDRGGYLYHGRIKALAEASRAGGLQF
jgi:large subunit ribosomal protein L18